MEDKIVKLGIVGLGRGRYVGALVLHDKNVKITAVADRNTEWREDCKKMYEKGGVSDVLYFSEYEDMLKEADIDAVYVCTDKPSHVKHVLMALDAGKHVISEIPAIETEEEAKILLDAVRSHPELKYMAAENCNYWAHIKAWKKMREDGMLGEIVYAEGEYLHTFREPDQIKPYPAGTDHWRRHNPAITYLTHELGPLLSVMDDKCVSVTCMEPSIVYNPYNDRAENGIALFRTAKGAVIRIFIGFGAYVGFGHNFAIYGTKGSLITDKTKDCYKAHTFAKMSSIPNTFENYFEIPIAAETGGNAGEMHGGADSKMMRDFIKCIIDDTQPPITVEDGIRMSLPGIIAHKSALQGGALLPIPDIDEL